MPPSATSCTIGQASCSQLDAAGFIPGCGWYLHCFQTLLRLAASAVKTTLQLPQALLNTSCVRAHLGMG